MIRPLIAADVAAVLDLVVAAEMFPADDTGPVARLLAAYVNDTATDGHLCLVDAAADLYGVAYYAPAPATDRTWYLTMIAVRPDQQGQGRGTALLRAGEAALRADKQRLLLVETSGTPQYDRTRQFYVQCGYAAVARVEDFWAAGDPLVLFRKALQSEES